MKRQLEDNSAGKSVRKLAKPRHKKSTQRPNKDGTCEEPQTTAKKCEEVLIREEAKEELWTPEEDAALVAEVGKCETGNWKLICKHLNQLFKGKKRTATECETRWRHVAPLDSPWTPHEELVLSLALYKSPGDYASIALIFPLGKNVKAHSIELLTEVARKARTAQYYDIPSASPIHVLQLMISLKLLLDAITEPDPVPEVLEIVQSTQVSAEDCINCVNVVGKSINPKIPQWDKATLEEYLETATEKIENGIVSVNPGQEGLEDIMHIRPPMGTIPQPQSLVLPQDPHIQYCLVPVSYVGQGYYVLALCYVPSAGPPPQL